MARAALSAKRTLADAALGVGRTVLSNGRIPLANSAACQTAHRRRLASSRNVAEGHARLQDPVPHLSCLLSHFIDGQAHLDT